MTSVAQPSPIDARSVAAGRFVTGVAFLALFWTPITTLARDWWSNPDSAHGLLLFPVATYLAWKGGLAEARPQRRLGLTLLAITVLLRYVSGLAAELFTMRVSLIGALVALLIYERGWRQIRLWWLPFTLLCLSVPIPVVILNSLALPLQLKASAMGTALLRNRHVPVLLEGNVLRLPGRSLFVTEACSGLRSLTALVALGVLVGGMWLGTAWARVALVAAAIPVAIVVNALRVFLTGFLIYYVNPALAEGFSHYTEGWALFIVAFGALGGLSWALGHLERRMQPSSEPPGAPPRSRDARPSEKKTIWAPIAVLVAGILLIVEIRSSAHLQLRIPLADALPREVGGIQGHDMPISEDEQAVAGMTSYLLRSYASTGVATADGFSIYVGYYESQTQGKTIHSPKNCLPGSGWEALQSSTTTIETASGSATVNRYLIQKGDQQALVLYWYQGRGRIQANEYAVKWNLLRDAALRRRSEEALVRIVVPITRGPDTAALVAREQAGRMVGDLNRALPS